MPPRLLIVDDERDNRDLFELVLKLDGFVTATASSGEEALASVVDQRPDLILLDVMMPGMNGYEVATKIKAQTATSDIPILMITALDDREVRTLALQAGAVDVLAKPVDRVELCRRVRAALNDVRESCP